MFGWMKKSEHEAAMGEMKRDLAREEQGADYLTKLMLGLERDNTDLRETNYALDRAAAKFRAERDAALSELATLKAHRERANDNLRAANAKRHAEKLAKNGTNRESVQ